jgi:hypothetical protein
LGNNDTLGECVSYLDGSSDWGPVVMADIHINGQVASNGTNGVPIQLINANYAQIPSSCTNPDESPDAVGFNGILGVGEFVQDCGSPCETNTGNQKLGIYWECTTSGACSSNIAMPTDNQVSYMGSNDQGVVLELPGVPSTGAVQAPGYIVFGIGSQTNNTAVSGSNSIEVYTAANNSIDQTTYGNILTSYDVYNTSGNYLQAFLDSGSNALYFPAPQSQPAASDVPLCSGGLSSFYCPSGVATLTATFMNAAGGNQKVNIFGVYDAGAAFDESNPNLVFNNLAGDLDSAFDWGLPFFLGRTVIVGLEGKSATINGISYTGPYWAF